MTIFACTLRSLSHKLQSTYYAKMAPSTVWTHCKCTSSHKADAALEAADKLRSIWITNIKRRGMDVTPEMDLIIKELSEASVKDGHMKVAMKNIKLKKSNQLKNEMGKNAADLRKEISLPPRRLWNPEVVEPGCSVVYYKILAHKYATKSEMLMDLFFTVYGCASLVLFYLNFLARRKKHVDESRS